MGSVEKHNEFIRDAETLFIYNVLPHIGENRQTEVLNLYMAYKEKWRNIFTLKKELGVDGLINQEREKILKLYNDLKNSINYNSKQIIDVDKELSVNTVKEKLQDILIYEKQLHGKLQIIQYQKGLILLQLKYLTVSKQGFTIALSKLVSYRHACKLISFYQTCEKYHNLRYTTLPFNKIINNLYNLEILMEQDNVFWNPVKEENVS